jgi:hypothetical protein
VWFSLSYKKGSTETQTANIERHVRFFFLNSFLKKKQTACVASSRLFFLVPEEDVKKERQTAGESKEK